jgi:hypothetical protein
VTVSAPADLEVAIDAAWQEYLATTRGQKAEDTASARIDRYEEVEVWAWNRLQDRLREIRKAAA